MTFNGPYEFKSGMQDGNYQKRLLGDDQGSGQIVGHSEVILAAYHDYVMEVGLPRSDRDCSRVTRQL